MKVLENHIVFESSVDNGVINHTFKDKTIKAIDFSTSECYIRFTDKSSLSVTCDDGRLEIWTKKGE